MLARSSACILRWSTTEHSSQETLFSYIIFWGCSNFSRSGFSSLCSSSFRFSCLWWCHHIFLFFFSLIDLIFLTGTCFSRFLRFVRVGPSIVNLFTLFFSYSVWWWLALYQSLPTVWVRLSWWRLNVLISIVRAFTMSRLSIQDIFTFLSQRSLCSSVFIKHRSCFRSFSWFCQNTFLLCQYSFF